MKKLLLVCSTLFVLSCASKSADVSTSDLAIISGGYEKFNSNLIEVGEESVTSPNEDDFLNKIKMLAKTNNADVVRFGIIKGDQDANNRIHGATRMKNNFYTSTVKFYKFTGTSDDLSQIKKSYNAGYWRSTWDWEKYNRDSN